MQQAEEFRKHAEECRVMASKMRNAPQREQLLFLAKQWDDLAEEREKISQGAGEIERNLIRLKPVGIGAVVMLICRDGP